MICLKVNSNCIGYEDGKCISIENCMHKKDELNNKEKIIKRIEENYEDMEDALIDNCAFDCVELFREYTNEIIKIINEELK